MSRAFRFSIAAGLVAGAAFSAPAMAATAEGQLTVQVTVLANCLVTGGTLTFPAPGNFSAQLTAATTFTVRCTSGTPYSVTLEGDNTTRSMVGPDALTTHTIPYLLFQTNGTTPWDETAPVGVLTGENLGAAKIFDVKGVLPVIAGAIPPPGVYDDVLTITVTY